MMSSVTSPSPTETDNSFEEEIMDIDDSSSNILNRSDVTIPDEIVPSSTSNSPTSFQTINTTLLQPQTQQAQVVPVVYVQQPPKLASISKTNSTSLLINSVPQIQFANMAPTMSSTTQICSSNQGVLMAKSNNVAKPQQIVIQKSGGGGNQLPKIAGATYVTMLKPMGDNLNTTQIQIATSSSPTLIQGSNTGHKYVLASMPKLTTNRLPSTVPRHSVQPKITLMPLPAQKPEPKFKVFNFQISDGQLQATDNSSGITVLCENNSQQDDNNLVCDEIIEIDSPTKQEEILEEVNTRGIGMSNENYILKTNDNMLKYPKHGISILKKNYSFSERRIDPPKLNKILTHTSNFISDVTVTKPSTGTKETIILSEPAIKPTITTAAPQKTGGRRKSNFSYRKDYDDNIQFFDTNSKDGTLTIELKKSLDQSDFSFTKVNSTENLNEEKQKEEANYVEIEVVKEKIEEKTDINMNDDQEIQKVLTWENGVGSLPGSAIKFVLNEFNMLEYITQNEYTKLIDKKHEEPKDVKIKARVKHEFQEEMRCVECGCFGLPSDFISPKYCSYDCQNAGKIKLLKEQYKEARAKKRKKLAEKKLQENALQNIIKDHPSSEEEVIDSSNDNSREKFDNSGKYSYPWACGKKGFSWSKYLEHVKAKAAPVKLFKEPFPYNKNGFRSGMKLEGVDPCHPSYFCVMSVVEVHGYRVRLHFDGYSNNYDLWVNADSMDIFPIGWCEKYGHVLHPPPGYEVDSFNWVTYLKATKGTAAPKHLFANRAGNAICPNGFRVGMKLEAVDKKNNTSLVCVATIRDMMDNRILVHFDSWDDIYDYWADPTSPYIHPVGWSDQHGHRLTPPNDYPSPEDFTWDAYLKERKAVAAPVRAFKQRPACGFKKGMRLECVDKRVPQLIRVATVDDVRGHQLRILFDGWMEKYSYWVEDDSSDIHPVGWCQKTGHSIEPPLTPDDVYDFQMDCPTIGCKGVGHVEGPKFAIHSLQKDCPYAEENVRDKKAVPDRLLSPDRKIESVVPISREPKEKPKPKIGRPPKYTKLENIKSEADNEDSLEPPKPKRKCKKLAKTENDSEVEERVTQYILDSQITPITPVERESWFRHSKFLKSYLHMKKDPRTWDKIDVLDFVENLPIRSNDLKLLREQEIDGEALLLLTQKDIIDILQIKVGPAIKLYHSIVLLRRNLVEKMFS